MAGGYDDQHFDRDYEARGRGRKLMSKNDDDYTESRGRGRRFKNNEEGRYTTSYRNQYNNKSEFDNESKSYNNREERNETRNRRFANDDDNNHCEERNEARNRRFANDDDNNDREKRNEARNRRFANNDGEDGNNYNDDNHDRGRRNKYKTEENFERSYQHKEKEDDSKAVEPPKERYIPPDPTENEEELFHTGIASGINFEKYDSIEINVTGDNRPNPITSFQDCGFEKEIMQNIKRCEYTKPTPVQKHSIPIIKAGRDMMACAQTGSGKTAAFLLPIINTLMVDYKEDLKNSFSVLPICIIVSPTRELTLQIFQEARKFSHNTSVKVAIAYGGADSRHQLERLMRGCHILVATPGRLNDFVSKKKVKFSEVKYFILDEADRMLDMGFKPAIEEMLHHETMPKDDKQMLMYSATFPVEIQRMAADYLNDYLFLTVGIVGGACNDVEQVIYECSKFKKREKLEELLNQSKPNELTLVFVETQRNADFLAALLSESNFPTTSIHGARLQSQRETALRDFKSGRMSTLVATAVAARGLDIKNVSHVINYDLPKTVDEYVHRIGRTGRVGNSGKASSFYDPSMDSGIASDLVTCLKQANQTIPPFLCDANFSSDFTPRSNFGASDIRENSSFDGVPTQLEETEDW